jgi:hypothetical protein
MLRIHAEKLELMAGRAGVAARVVFPNPSFQFGRRVRLLPALQEDFNPCDSTLRMDNWTLSLLKGTPTCGRPGPLTDSLHAELPFCYGDLLMYPSISHHETEVDCQCS